MFRSKAYILVAGVVAVVATAAAVATAQKPAEHLAINAAELKWGPAPPGLPPGAQAAVIEGDPSKAGEPFAVRIKAPDGFKVPPHWHPSDERVVVLSGTLMIGLGEKMDASKAHSLTAGGYARMPKEVRHFAAVKGETIFQVSGMGPFEITYVNPNDDPRKKKTQ